MIDLHDRKITDEQMGFISDALKINQHVTTLILFKNNLTNKGAKFICELIESNDTINSLDLRQNQIETEGYIDIYNSLKVNTTIKELQLTNDFDNHVRSKIEKIISINKYFPLKAQKRAKKYNKNLGHESPEESLLYDEGSLDLQNTIFGDFESNEKEEQIENKEKNRIDGNLIKSLIFF